MSDHFNDTDVDLFFSEMDGVKPFQQDKVVTPVKKAKAALEQLANNQYRNQYSVILAKLDELTVTPLADPLDPISYRSDGMQSGVFKNLRLAKYDIDARIDIRGLSLTQAMQELLSYLIDCYNKNTRVILVQHGLGKENSEFPAKLKAALNTWLPHIPVVQGAHSALTQHGGSSACYILLKKNEHQKQLNRELHAKK